MQLVGDEIQVTGWANGKGVRPDNPRIMDDGVPSAGGQALANTVVLIVSGVNGGLSIRLKSIGGSLLVQVTYTGLQLRLTYAWIAQ